MTYDEIKAGLMLVRHLVDAGEVEAAYQEVIRLVRGGMTMADAERGLSVSQVRKLREHAVKGGDL